MDLIGDQIEEATSEPPDEIWDHRGPWTERRGGVGAIDVASDFAGLFYRVSSALSVRIQQISSRLVGSSLVPGSYLSRAEAGTPDFWEAAVAAAGADFTADVDEAMR